MRCSEFRELIFERLSGELHPEQETECTAHERSCPICRAELAQFRDVSVRLRAGWPSEEPMPMRIVLPERVASRWFDAATLWFSRASAGLVAASLLFLVLVRPSVQVGRNGVELIFGRAAAKPAVTASATPSLNEAQVKARVEAAVEQEMAHAKPVRVVAPAAPQKSPEVTQVAMQLRQVQQAQATLWEEVQQHGLYLESLWKANAPTGVKPASLSQ